MQGNRAGEAMMTVQVRREEQVAWTREGTAEEVRKVKFWKEVKHSPLPILKNCQ